MPLESHIGKVALEADEVNALIVARRQHQVVEMIGRLLFCRTDGKVADMQAALGIVECPGSEVGIDGTREGSRTKLVSQMESSRRDVDDFSHETHFLSLLTGVLEDIFCQFSLHLGSQMGIVYSQVARDGSLSIAAIDGNILIGIAIVV